MWVLLLLKTLDDRVVHYEWFSFKSSGNSHHAVILRKSGHFSSFYIRCKEMFYFLCSIFVFVYFSFLNRVESVLYLKSNMQIFHDLPSPYCDTLQPSFRVFQMSTFVETSYTYIFTRISVSVCLMGNSMLLCQCFEGKNHLFSSAWPSPFVQMRRHRQILRNHDIVSCEK